MNVLGIDPGPEYVAWALTDGKEIIASASESIPDFVEKSFAIAHEAAIIAIETPQSYGPSVNAGRSLYQTCITIGRIIQGLQKTTARERIKLYGRPTIRGHLNAKNDGQVRASLRARLCDCNSRGACKIGCRMHGLNNDQRAALAVAIVVLERPEIKEW